MTQSDQFVRFPTVFLEALMRAPLSGAQWRIVLWVIRQTLGWNRDRAPFSWYRIAKELTLDRGGVARAGKALIQSGILLEENRQIGIERDHAQWRHYKSASLQPMTSVHGDGRPLKAMTGIIGTDDDCNLNSGQASSLFRRVKDSKERKIYRDSDRTDDARRRSTGGIGKLTKAFAGAASPIPGKYDGLSQSDDSIPQDR